jgi:DNA-directed RNA polymerase subunit RPC12/RpoP
VIDVPDFDVVDNDHPCPNCGHEGPHTMVAEGVEIYEGGLGTVYECGSCYHEFEVADEDPEV